MRDVHGLYVQAWSLLSKQVTGLLRTSVRVRIRFNCGTADDLKHGNNDVELDDETSEDIMLCSNEMWPRSCLHLEGGAQVRVRGIKPISSSSTGIC